MTLAAGTRLGSYEIVAPLGSGGMGEVYRARDAKLEREVAIKVLPATVANDPDALARFEREAKAVAALSHPNILAIHDFGSDDGVAYAVTELLEGDTLRGKLDAGPIAQRQGIDWALQIAKGLSAAHEKGIVHRDLKPENVFVTKAGHVKILDFGLAKKVDAASPGAQTSAPTGTGHTEPGTVMGTMGYMSPEQVKGQPVDHRSDIFSFGTILYEMLSGKRAFKRDTSAETIAAILTQEPPELTGSGRNVSPALDHVVRHCLEKEPGNRFGTANDVAFALSEASGATTITSGPPSVVSAKPARTRMLAAGILLIAAAVAGFLLLRRPHRAPATAAGVRRIAVLPFENLGAPDEEYFADGIADEIRGKLTSLPGVQVIARGSSTPYKRTDKTPRQIAGELNVDYLLTATVRSDKSGGAPRVQVRPELVDVSQPETPTSKWQQTFDAPLTDVFKVQSDIATQVAQSLGVALGAGQEKQLAERPTQSLPAYEAYLRGMEANGGGTRNDAQSLRKALSFFNQAVALDPGFALAWGRVSSVNGLLYSNDAPLREYSERARDAAERVVAIAPNDPEAYRAMGNYQRLIRNDPAAALDQFARGRKIAPGNVDLLRSSALAEMTLGQFDAAVEHLRDAVRLDPRSATLYNVLGEVYLRTRRYTEARQNFDAGLALVPDSLDIIENRAISFLGEGDLRGAQSSVASLPKTIDQTSLVVNFAMYWDLGWALPDEQRLLLRQLTAAAFDGDRAQWGLALAQELWWRGDPAGARTYADQAAAAIEEELRGAPNDPDRMALLGIALAYGSRGEEAIRQGLHAVELRPVTKDFVEGPYFLQLLARIYTIAGQPEKAVDALEQLLRVPFWVSPAWLKIDPSFDPLRNNPRFQKIAAGAE